MSQHLSCDIPLEGFCRHRGRKTLSCDRHSTRGMVGLTEAQGAIPAFCWLEKKGGAVPRLQRFRKSPGGSGDVFQWPQTS